jgi:hypothetical protein
MHVPDIFVFKPLYFEGERIAFAQRSINPNTTVLALIERTTSPNAAAISSGDARSDRKSGTGSPSLSSPVGRFAARTPPGPRRRP